MRGARGQQREADAADEAERHDQRATGSSVISRPCNRIGHAAAMISRLKKVAAIIASSANRVSIQRPSTTTGRNRIRYAAAPRVSGDGLKLNDTADCACDRISDRPMTEPSAVPLVMAMVRLVSGGMVSRIACGSTTHSQRLAVT